METRARITRSTKARDKITAKNNENALSKLKSPLKVLKKSSNVLGNLTNSPKKTTSLNEILNSPILNSNLKGKKILNSPTISLNILGNLTNSPKKSARLHKKVALDIKVTKTASPAIITKEIETPLKPAERSSTISSKVLGNLTDSTKKSARLQKKLSNSIVNSDIEVKKTGNASVITKEIETPVKPAERSSTISSNSPKKSARLQKKLGNSILNSDSSVKKTGNVSVITKANETPVKRTGRSSTVTSNSPKKSARLQKKLSKSISNSNSKVKKTGNASIVSKEFETPVKPTSQSPTISSNVLGNRATTPKKSARIQKKLSDSNSIIQTKKTGNTPVVSREIENPVQPSKKLCKVTGTSLVPEDVYDFVFDASKEPPKPAKKKRVPKKKNIATAYRPHIKVHVAPRSPLHPKAVAEQKTDPAITATKNDLQRDHREVSKSFSVDDTKIITTTKDLQRDRQEVIESHSADNTNVNSCTTSYHLQPDHPEESKVIEDCNSESQQHDSTRFLQSDVNDHHSDTLDHSIEQYEDKADEVAQDLGVENCFGFDSSEVSIFSNRFVGSTPIKMAKPSTSQCFPVSPVKRIRESESDDLPDMPNRIDSQVARDLLSISALPKDKKLKQTSLNHFSHHVESESLAESSAPPTPQPAFAKVSIFPIFSKIRN